MSQDDVTSEEEVELTTSSEETQNDSVEDNSHSEPKKNQSNFKKLANKAKELHRENERLKAQLASRTDSVEDDGDDFDLDSLDDEPFADTKSEIWFMKNKDAEQYRDKMAALVAEKPVYASLPLSDIYELTKAKFPKSKSKSVFEISSGRSSPVTDKDIASVDVSKMSEEQIMKLPPDMYKKLFLKK